MTETAWELQVETKQKEFVFASQQTMPNCTLNNRSIITTFSTDNDELTSHNTAEISAKQDI